MKHFHLDHSFCNWHNFYFAKCSGWVTSETYNPCLPQTDNFRFKSKSLSKLADWHSHTKSPSQRIYTELPDYLLEFIPQLKC